MNLNNNLGRILGDDYKIRKNTEKACKEIDGAEYKNVPINYSWKFWEKKENRFKEIIDIINKAKENGDTLLIQCKSGKDRTAFAQLLKNTVDYAKDKDKEKDNLLKFIEENKLFDTYTNDHTQEYQSSNAGGTSGITGIKSDGWFGPIKGKLSNIFGKAKELLGKLGGNSISRTNGLDQLNKFKAENCEKDIEAIERAYTQKQNASNEISKSNFCMYHFIWKRGI